MLFQKSERVTQKVIEAGTPILENKASVAHLVQIHQGHVYVYNPKLEPKRKVLLYALVDEKHKGSIPGVLSLIEAKPLNFTYTASTRATLSAFPLPEPIGAAFQKITQTKIDTALMSLKSLYIEVVSSYQAIQTLIQYRIQLQRYLDNTSTLLKKRISFSLQGKNEIAKNVLEKIKSFENATNLIPDVCNPSWLQEDHFTKLGFKYTFDSKFNLPLFQKSREALSLSQDILSQKIKAEPAFLTKVGQDLAGLLKQNVNEIIFLQDEIEQIIDLMFSSSASLLKSWKEYRELANKKNEFLKEYNEITVFFYRMAQYIFNFYQNSLKETHPMKSEVLEKIPTLGLNNKVVSTPAPNSSPQTPRPSSQGSYQASVDYGSSYMSLKDAPSKIMMAVGVSDEEKKLFLESLAKLKANNNPLDPSVEFRKLRRNIVTLYWKIWNQALQLYKKNNGKVPREVSLLLNFGFIDRDFIDDSHANFIIDKSIENTSTKYPIVNIIDWLEKISSREEAPSIDELGQSYFEKMKLEHKANWKKEDEIPKNIDTNEYRVTYEINGFLELNNRLTTGAPTNYLPFMNRYQLLMPIERTFVSKKILDEKISQILEIDYTAFHREIVFNDEKIGILKEFIQKQVIPYFIIIPSIGTKAMMWQELSGRNKTSHGRIVIPIFATGDLYTMLALAIAAFRWELTKSVMGSDWNNMSLSSITADYTDYVQFYKKNKDLSIEIKDKLSSEFKRFRTDRDRFSNDYLNWLQYESKGALKLNKVVRNIFYKHVPFKKELRDHLSKQPAFTEIHNRFKNIRTIKYNQLEARYRKFGDYIISDLKENLEFYKV